MSVCVLDLRVYKIQHHAHAEKIFVVPTYKWKYFPWECLYLSCLRVFFTMMIYISVWVRLALSCFFSQFRNPKIIKRDNLQVVIVKEVSPNYFRWILWNLSHFIICVSTKRTAIVPHWDPWGIIWWASNQNQSTLRNRI